MHGHLKETRGVFSVKLRSYLSYAKVLRAKQDMKLCILKI